MPAFNHQSYFIPTIIQFYDKHKNTVESNKLYELMMFITIKILIEIFASKKKNFQ